jgi:hypothetical protein
MFRRFRTGGRYREVIQNGVLGNDGRDQLVLAVTGCTGTKNATVQAAAPKVLSDAYTIQVLLALKSIQRDLFIPENAAVC